MRILIRTSRAAIWAGRLGSFAIPVLVLAVLFHRFGSLSTAAFEISLSIATATGAAAVLLAIGAFVRIWNTGDKGWTRASLGLIGGLAALAPLGYALVMMALYPSTADIATDPATPPELLYRPEDDTVLHLSETARAANFPQLVTRTYQIEPERLFAITEEAVAAQGWALVRRSAPRLPDAPGLINATATTLFGWTNEVALRVDTAPLGAQVVMRSASVRDTGHDLGDNGRQIEAFLVALDAAVTQALRESVPVPDVEDAVPEDEQPSEPQGSGAANG